MSIFGRVRDAVLTLFLLTASAQAATLGYFYDAPSNLNNITAARAYVAANAPTATFTALALDFPAGSNTTTTANSSLLSYTGANAVDVVGTTPSNIRSSVFVFEGYLDLRPGAQTFAVSSTEGFLLQIGGTTIDFFAGTRGYATSTVFVDAGSGPVAFRLYHFVQNGQAGLNFSIDGVTVQGMISPPGEPPSSIPLPASLPLAAGGLALLRLLRRRR